MSPRHIPNILTIARIVLVAPVAMSLIDRAYGLALVLFGVAGFSDGLDGFLAKRYGWGSRLGGFLDPVADKLLLMTSYVCLAYIGLIPVWLTVAVIARDVVIVSGALAYIKLVGGLAPAPSFISKLNTLMQILLVLALVAGEAFQPLPAGWAHALIYAVLATTVLSGLDYVWTWSIRAWQESR